MPIIEYNNEYFMQQAIIEANQALSEQEVPIGCVIVCNNRIIARGHNMTERLKDATSHAEMIAITSAQEFLSSKYLDDCTLYVTLEPCIMCAGAILLSHIRHIVYGCKDQKRGYSSYCNPFPKNTIIECNVLQQECSKIISDFFKDKRK